MCLRPSREQGKLSISILWLSNIILLFGLVAPGLAKKSSSFNVDCFFGWGGCYRPMEWTPLEIGISTNLTEPFGGMIEIYAQQDGLNTLHVSREIALTADMPLYLPMATKFAFAADECVLRLYDQRGKVQWDQKYDLWDYSSENRLLTSLGEQDLLIGFIGSGKFGLFRLPQHSICTSRQGAGQVYVKNKLPRMAPWDWTGYVSLDLLILYDPDWLQFNAQQLNAIAQWVSNGGKILMIVAAHPLSADNPLAQIMPFQFDDARQVTIDGEVLKKWQLDNTQQETVVGRFLTATDRERFCKFDSPNKSLSLAGVCPVGFGYIAVLGFDPSIFSEKQKGYSSQFWVHHIRNILETDYMKKCAQEFPQPTNEESDSPQHLSRSRRGMPGMRRHRTNNLPTIRGIEYHQDSQKLLEDNQDDHFYEISQAQAAGNSVMEHLYDISEMRPLSIWYVIAMLAVLSLLLGPIDYLVLKRIDQLPLTWLTSAGWIILFTAGAYYGVQMLRSGNMQIRTVCVADAVENSYHHWSTTYMGIFAPASDSYQLKGVEKNQWWSGIAPSQEHIYSYNSEAGLRNIHCYQHDGANLPYSLPINIWTMQCLLNEFPPSQVPVTAQVKYNGDEITLTITNFTDAPISSGYVLVGNDRKFDFNIVPAQSTQAFTGKSIPAHDWHKMLGHTPYRSPPRAFQFANETAYWAQGTHQRTQAIQNYLTLGAAIVCVQWDRAPLPVSIKDKKCEVNNIQILRLIVFPSYDNEDRKS